MTMSTNRVHTHDIIEAWEQFTGDDVTAFYAEWDRRLEQLHKIQRGEQPHLLVEITVEDALSIQEALDEWQNDATDGGATLAEHLRAIVDKLKEGE